MICCHPSETKDSDARVVSGRGRAGPLVVGTAAPGTGPPAAGAPPAAAAPDPPEWPALQALLARPVNYPDHGLRRPRMREVPRLSPESEVRLIARWGQTNSLRAKQHLLRILAFGGWGGLWGAVAAGADRGICRAGG